MKTTKTNKVALLLAMVMIFTTLFTGCGSQSDSQSSAQNGGSGDGTQIFTDSCGREVEVPANIERIAPCGSSAQMILATLAPDLLVGLSVETASDEKKYLPESFEELPVLGQFYGKKSTLNMESLIAADPQISIDLGDKKDGVSEDMDSVQEQTGVPTVFIEMDIAHMAEGYRTLGKLLNREEKAEELASFVDKTLEMAETNSAKISEDDMLSVMYALGTSGLDCNAEGSPQATVIDMVGAKNAIVVPEGELSTKGGGNTVSMEQVYVFNPDVVILADKSAYDSVGSSAEWSQLEAAKNGKYYRIPCEPYNWMSAPPSVNSIMGVWWLGNLLYPEIYDYDMTEITKEYYSLFFNYDLSDDEVNVLLADSVMK